MKRSFSFTTTTLAISLFSMALSTPATADTMCDVPLMRGSIAQLNPTQATVFTSILIDAPAEDVWEVLTDFDTMASWSTTTLQGMTGDIQNGGSVVITFIFGTDEDGAPISNEIPHTLIYD